MVDWVGRGGRAEGDRNFDPFISNGLPVRRTRKSVKDTRGLHKCTVTLARRFLQGLIEESKSTIYEVVDTNSLK